MRLIDRITGHFKHDKTEPGTDWNAMNRSNRRRGGFRGRVVPLEFFKPERENFAPRYWRRHHAQMVGLGPFTRRQRKAKARGKLIFLLHAGVAPKTLSAFRARRIAA